MVVKNFHGEEDGLTSRDDFYLRYVFDGDTHYVRSPGVIAVIIDYGQSYAKINGRGFGASTFLDDIIIGDDMGRFTDRSYLQSDIFHLFSGEITKGEYSKKYNGRDHSDTLKHIRLGYYLMQLIPRNISINKPDPNCSLLYLEMYQKVIENQPVSIGIPDDPILAEVLAYFYSYAFMRRYRFVPDTPQIRDLDPETLFENLCDIYDVDAYKFITKEPQRFLTCSPTELELREYESVELDFSNYRSYVRQTLGKIKHNEIEDTEKIIKHDLLSYLNSIKSYAKRTRKDFSEQIDYLQRIIGRI